MIRLREVKGWSEGTQGRQDSHTEVGFVHVAGTDCGAEH